MKWLVVGLLVIADNCLSVSSHRCEYSAEEFSSYKYTVEQIDTLMEKEAKYHKFNLDHNGGETYLSRVQYILEALNNKISSSYLKSQGSSGNNLGCKQLESEILTKSKQLGIEKIVLESNLERLRKVLNYQDQRIQVNDALLEMATNETQTCVLRTTVLEKAILSLASKREEQSKIIKDLEGIIKLREKEISILQRRGNANSSINATATDSGQDNTAAIPDIEHF